MIWRALAVCAGLALAAPVQAQEAAPLPQNLILTIEPERLFAESAFGKRIASRIDEAGAALAAENRQIEAELTAEEKALTEKRADMEPSAFSALADAFDDKVQTIRREQDTKARALSLENDRAQVDFLNAIRPVLEELMLEAGSSVILERSSVFLSLNTTDITEIAIGRIDAAIGEGPAD